jgi:hypothetical protein
MNWQPIGTAPSNKRILVCDGKGNVRIARLATFRWMDDADTIIGRPLRWMSLPSASSQASVNVPLAVKHEAAALKPDIKCLVSESGGSQERTNWGNLRIVKPSNDR